VRRWRGEALKMLGMWFLFLLGFFFFVVSEEALAFIPFLSLMCVLFARVRLCAMVVDEMGVFPCV
jgi:hypothetical protein